MPISSDRILYQDDHLLLVNKLSGELVVKGAGKVEKLPLLDFLKQDFPGLKPVNRLDFETSGIVIFAKTKDAFEASVEQMSSWNKVYLTIVKGKLGRKIGVINNPLPARNSRGNVQALTRYKVLENFALTTYVECLIETGRHHQIRQHFAFIKHPIVLDDRYGDVKFNKAFTRELKYRKFFLHASRLKFAHPITGEKLVVEAPLPKVFASLLKKLG